MKIKYQQYFPDSDDMYPILPVTLAFRGNKCSVRCLLDSGATRSVFNFDIAVELGIDLKTARREIFQGVGNVEVEGFGASIDLNVSGFSNWITIDAGFVNDDDMPLLGRSGIFDNYQIIFEQYLGRFQILSKIQKKLI